jgi:hypothetical protein
MGSPGKKEKVVMINIVSMKPWRMAFIKSGSVLWNDSNRKKYDFDSFLYRDVGKIRYNKSFIFDLLY